EHLHVLLAFRQGAGYFLDHLVSGVRYGIYRVAKADDHFLVVDSLADIGFCLVWRVVALLNFKGYFVCTAMFRTTKGTDAPCNGRVHVRARPGNDAAGKGRRIEFM